MLAEGNKQSINARHSRPLPPPQAAGCMMPGEFEERLKAVTVEIEQSDRRIVLFIDDIHNLVGGARGRGRVVSIGAGFH